MCWRSDTYPLTHLSVTSHEWKSTQSNTNLSNIIWLIMTVPRHTIKFYTHHTYVHVNFIPSSLSDKWRTYMNSIIHSFLFLPHISGIPNSSIFLLSHLTPRVQISCFLTHASICNHALVSFFSIGLTKNSTTALTHVLRYISFLKNGLYYTTKTSHLHINKTTFTLFIQFQLTILSSLFLQVSWQVYIPHFQRSPVFGWIHSVNTSDQFTAWSGTLSYKIPVEHDIIQTWTT